MSDKIQVTPRIVDEIEFYVSDDGQSCIGMSISGLARFTGIPRRTLSDFLRKVDGGLFTEESGFQPFPENFKTLEPLKGKVFDHLAVGSNNAKIIPAKTCSKIIRYFAYDAPNKTEEAKYTFDKFAEIGIETWIKEITGFVETSKGLANQEVINLLKLLDNKVTALTQVTTEYKQIRNTTTVTFPNLDKMLDDLKEGELFELKDCKSNRIPLNAWLASKGMTLDKSTFHRFASLVADAYKATVGKEPPKITIKLGKGRYRPNISGYSPDEFPMLEMCLRKLLLNQQ